MAGRSLGAAHGSMSVTRRNGSPSAPVRGPMVACGSLATRADRPGGTVVPGRLGRPGKLGHPGGRDVPGGAPGAAGSISGAVPAPC